MGFLTDLVGSIRRDLDARPLELARLQALAHAQTSVRPFLPALRSVPAPAVIAEVKRSSPSAGTIARDADPAALAAAYEAGGAAAISVLTEPRHFGGSLEDLSLARAAVSIPVLRKDFLIEPGQLVEARAAGADSVLLIAACLEGAALGSMLAEAGAWEMEALVETHSDRDLDRALDAGASVIGVNARDLETLVVDVDAALERLRRIPADRVAVLESGVRSHEDVSAAAEAGAGAVLVGETLMRAADPAAAIRALSQARAAGRTPERVEGAP